MRRQAAANGRTELDCNESKDEDRRASIGAVRANRMRDRAYNTLGPSPDTPLGRMVSGFLTAVIVLNVIALIVGTVQQIHDLLPRVFLAIEVVSVAIFTAEYLLRVWSCTADPSYNQAFSGRIRYIASPLMLVDLLAILPFFITLAIPVPVDLRILRSVRLAFRIARCSSVSP